MQGAPFFSSSYGAAPVWSVNNSEQFAADGLWPSHTVAFAAEEGLHVPRHWPAEVSGMGRWDFDDPRDGQSSESRSGHGRGGIDQRAVHVESLPDGLAARSIEVGGGREHSLALPSGLDREAIHLDSRCARWRELLSMAPRSGWSVLRSPNSS